MTSTETTTRTAALLTFSTFRQLLRTGLTPEAALSTLADRTGATLEQAASLLSLGAELATDGL